MLELAILGLLKEEPLHGYELKKRLGELLGPWSSMSYGSLYPALARLEKAGAVRAIDAEHDTGGALGAPAMPMTGALSGELAAFRRRPPRERAPRGRRGKKVYGITDAGRERFAELLRSHAGDDDRTFALRVALCRHLPPHERLALFAHRRAELASQLAERRAGERRGDLYLRSLRERDTRNLTNDIAWIDELIAATDHERDLDGDADPRDGDQLAHAATLATTAVPTTAVPTTPDPHTGGAR